MNITRVAVNKPVAVLVLTFLVIAIGIYSYITLGNSIFPEVNFGTYVINTSYPGASATVVEEQITKKVEDSLSGAPNIRDISSTSQSGFSSVTVTFAVDADKDKTRTEVQKRVTALQTSLPKDAKNPNLIEYDPDQSPSIIFVFKGSNVDELNKFIKNNVIPQITKLDEVADLRIIGQEAQQVQIKLNPQSLVKYNVSYTEVINALKQPQNVPAGQLTSNNIQNPIIISSGLQSINFDELLNQINNTKIQTLNNSTVNFSNLGTVEIIPTHTGAIFRENGQDAVQVGILKKSDASTTTLSTNSINEINLLMKDAPSSVNESIQYDSSKSTNDSLAGVLESLVEGILLTGLVLLLFLKSPKSTLIVLLSIPTSLVVTFISMKILGFNLNILSLLGVALCIGILVDDSIVVIENIYRKLSRTKDSKEAAVQGRSEIAGAALAITFVDVAVFLPLVLLNGFIIQFFKQFAIVIVTATLTSLLVSFTLTPLLASFLLRRKDKESRLMKLLESFLLFGIPFSIIGAVIGKILMQNLEKGIILGLCVALLISLFLLFTKLINRVISYEKVYDYEGHEDGVALKSLAWFEVILNLITRFYKTTLTFSVSSWLGRIIVLILVFTAFLGSILLSRNLKFEFLSSDDTGIGYLDFQLKNGTNINETEKISLDIENYILGNKDKYSLKNIYVSLGRGAFSGSDDSISLTLDAGDSSQRSQNIKDIVNNLKGDISSNVILPEGTKSSASVQQSGPPTEADIIYSISGPDFDKLQQINSILLNKLNGISYLKDIRSTVSSQIPIVQLTQRQNVVQSDPAIARGIISLYSTGIPVTEALVNNDPYDVLLSIDNPINSINSIKSLPLMGSGQGIINVGQEYDVTQSQTFSQIDRFNKNRVIQILSNLSGNTDTGTATRDINKIISNIKSDLNLSDEYKIEPQGNQRQITESFSVLFTGILLSIIAIYAILAILYESFLAPLIIMLSLPTAIIGAFLSLLIFNRSLDLLAMIGLIILMGLVTKNGILLVDFILNARRNGESLKTSIIDAGTRRLRPILMTTVSLIVGSIPLILGAVQGAQLRQSVATVFVGGLTSSLFLTLYFIPVIYSVFGSLKEKFTKRKAKKPEVEYYKVPNAIKLGSDKII